VGSYAVQIAKAFGAEVTGVASTAKMDLVRTIGADHVLDYTEVDFADHAAAYDLILDIGGNPALRRLRRALSPTGTAVIVGGEHGGSLTGGMHRTLGALVLSLFVRQRFTNFIAKRRSRDLEKLGELLRAGSIVPVIDSTRPVDRAREALTHLESGHVRGKCVLTMSSHYATLH
jgi:NADPH:quinone reductase-like Zn-dependent oxidoreductase